MSDGESRLRAAQSPTPMADWRASLASAPSGASLLDKLLSPHDAAALVRRLPVEDLYSYIGRIGLEDADGVLALASGAQVQGLVDIDTWQRDELSVDRLDPWLTALMRAGPEVLGARILELDDSMITFILRTSVKVLVIDDPETFDPPDIEHVLTPDGRLCICFPESAPRDLPVKIFLDWLIQHHPVYTVNLLVFSGSALDSNLQEDAYRWRSARMADLGYVDYYEALKIYVSAPTKIVDELGEINVVESPPSRWLKTLSRGKDRLQTALSSVEPEHLERVQASLAYAMNMALSADRIEAWDRSAQETVIQRVHAGLALGLDALNGGDVSAEDDAELLARVPASTLFRIGYGRILDAAKAARATDTGRALAGVEGAYEAVDVPVLQPWVESLTGRHPTLP